MSAIDNIPQYTLSELTQGLDVIIKGDPDCLISGVCSIGVSAASDDLSDSSSDNLPNSLLDQSSQKGQKGRIAFLANSTYKKYLAATSAAAIILSPKDAPFCPVNAVISTNPYYVYAKVAARFAKNNNISSGVHSSAVVGRDTHIDPSASVGPHCVIGERVRIAPRAVLGAGCFIGDDVEIGEDTEIDARAILYHGCKVGARTHIASGAVIGGEGFGFAQANGAWHKVPQLGCVVIGDDVEVGANTTIDRGAIDNTIIGNGVKLDNLIQIGHNVKIGENTIIAGCVGIAGSAVIGKNCMIGGKTGINGHINIADRVVITGMTVVSKSIYKAGVYSSGMGGVVTNQEWRKNSARLNRIEQLVQRVKILETTLEKLTERK